MKHVIMNPEKQKAAMGRYYEMLIKEYFESLKIQENKIKQENNKAINKAV